MKPTVRIAAAAPDDSEWCARLMASTEPWITLLIVGGLYIGSIPVSVRSYRRLRQAADELRQGLQRAASETGADERAAQ